MSGDGFVRAALADLAVAATFGLMDEGFDAALDLPPRFRYFLWPKAKSGGRWDRWYAWTTERTRGLHGGPLGFYAVEYVDAPKVLRVVRAVRFARRKAAKARALRWYETAKDATVAEWQRKAGELTAPDPDARDGAA